MENYFLLVECPDRAGLVYTITGALFRRGHNVVGNQEFVDRRAGRFFMRTEYTGAGDQQELLVELRMLLPEAEVRLAATGRRNIVVMATREHHCLGELLLRDAYGELPARIQAVISNADSLRSLVERFEVPFYHVTPDALSREAHEAQILELLAGYRPEYLVLAKYMRILTPGFVARYPQRIVNIHHSFLPAFVGASPYRQAFDRGVKIIGATAHFVTDGLDEGPIIAQSVIPVDHSHTAEEMAQAGRDVEKIVLAQALRLVCEERIFLCNGRTIIFD